MRCCQMFSTFKINFDLIGFFWKVKRMTKGHQVFLQTKASGFCKFDNVAMIYIYGLTLSLNDILCTFDMRDRTSGVARCIFQFKMDFNF